MNCVQDRLSRLETGIVRHCGGSDGSDQLVHLTLGAQCLFPVDFVVFDVPGSVRREKKAGTGRRRPVVAVGLELGGWELKLCSQGASSRGSAANTQGGHTGESAALFTVRIKCGTCEKNFIVKSVS